jgi:hypothetical protein
MTKRSDEQNELDAALKATFPSSDPVAIGGASGSGPDRPLHRKPAKLDVALVEELAGNVTRKQASASDENADSPATEKDTEKTPSFSVDRKGESSAGALTPKDKERSVAARRDGSNNR